METPRRPDWPGARPKFLLWLNTVAKLRARLFTLERGNEETPVTPEDTLRAAGVSNRRQAEYQRKMSTLLGKGATHG